LCTPEKIEQAYPEIARKKLNALRSPTFSVECRMANDANRPDSEKPKSGTDCLICEHTQPTNH
jgi:hypothetical protein